MLGKYKVTTMFGLLPLGTVVDCYIVHHDQHNNRALIYFPAEIEYECNGEKDVDSGCPSLDICQLKNGMWESISEETYINLVEINKDLIDYLSILEKQKC